ncbi:MAG: hypothetical protein ACLFQ7_06935 [Phormidium sp.]
MRKADGRSPDSVNFETPVVVQVPNWIAPVVRPTSLTNHGLILESVVIWDDSFD